jgi:tetratricopeptide (TPR) repeat protein
VATATPEEATVVITPALAPALSPAAIETLPTRANPATSHHAPAPAANPDAEPTTVLDNLGQRPASNMDDLDQALETLAAQQAGEKSPAEWLELGRAHYKAGRFKEATLVCSLAVQGDAYYADAYCLKGDALRQLGDNARALDAYRCAFNVNPGLTHAYVGTGHTYQSIGNFTRAVIAYDEAIRQAPDEPFAYVFKSQALKNLGDDAEGLKALECAIEKKPDYAFAWHLKGEALARLGRLAEAQPAFQEASKLGYKP